MKTTYKALTRFGGYEAGDEFEAELDPKLERRAKERGQIRVVKRGDEPNSKKEEKADG